jgi:ABC-type sugar transport system permease subunit
MRSKRRSKALLITLMLFPSVLVFALYRVVPLTWNFVLSFLEWNFVKNPVLVGLSHYGAMLSDSVFWLSLRNMAIYFFGATPVSIVLALGIAILVNKPLPGRFVYRALVFLPYPMTPVAIAMVWKWLYNEKVGLINFVLRSTGIVDRGIGFLSSGWALPSVIFTTVWHVLGYYMIIILAGLQTIPSALYESADLDGASGLAKLRFITLPLIRSTIFLCFVVGIINSFSMFDIIYVMTDGGPGHSTEILMTYIYKNAFTYGNVGYAAAMTVIMFLLLLAITVVSNRISGGEAGGAEHYYG